MKKLESKFLRLLSDPSVKDDELTIFFNKLKDGELETYFNKARKMRRVSTTPASRDDEDHGNSDVSSHEQTIVDQVDRLLRKEARLTVSLAIEALGEQLQIPVHSNKRSFRDQILELCKHTDGPEIIHAAHKIRNKLTHYVNESHWPLKDAVTYP